MHVVVRAPNHFGDGVMAIPAIRALAQVAQLTIAAPAWGSVLYEGYGEICSRGHLPSSDAAILLAPSLRAAWEARSSRRRIGTPTDFRRWLLTDVVEECGHRRDTYAALAAVLGAEVTGAPSWQPKVWEEVDVPLGHIGFNPYSVSGAVVEWGGFQGLATQISRDIVWYTGPGEQIPDHFPGFKCIGLPLPAFAAALRRCVLFVSNDSGAAHFARACGVSTLVIFGSTTPEHTGPDGAFAVQGPKLPCQPCYQKTCHRGLGCLAISIGEVLGAMTRILGESP